jgi:hypothetical protein
MPQLRYVLFSFKNYKSKCQLLSNDVGVKQKRQGKPKGRILEAKNTYQWRTKQKH